MEFRIESSYCDLEQTIGAVIAALAAERGVSVKETRLDLRSISKRELKFEVSCDVRAMIVSATLVVRGRAVISDDLSARFDELAIEGDGMIAGLAKAALGPRLDELRGHAYPLAAAKLPGLRVADVAVSVGDTVRLTAVLTPIS